MGALSKSPAPQSGGGASRGGALGGASGKAAPASKSSGKSFFGVRLPTVLGVNLPDLGVSLKTPGPIKQARDMVAGAVPSLARLGGALGGELLDPKAIFSFRQRTPESTGWQNVEKQMPMSGMILESGARTARQVPDTAVAVRPGGPGFGKSNLGRQIRDEGYLATGLAKVSDVAMLAGGVGAVGRGVGAARLADAARLERLAGATSQAAKLGKADEFRLAEAASAASASGDVAKAMDLARAADQMADATRLRDAVAGSGKATRGAEKVTAGAASVSRMGNKVAAAPFLPSQKALGAIGKGAGLAARSKTLAPAVARVEAAAARLTQKRAIGDLHHENVTAPFQAEMHTLFQREGLEAAARNLDLDEQAAVYLTKSAEDVAARQLLDAVADLDPEVRPDVIARLFPDGDVTPAQIELAIAFRDGTLPAKQQAKLQEAADAVSGAAKRRTEETYVTGRGTSRPLSEAALEARAQRAAGKSADLDVAKITERKQAPIKARMADRADEAARLENAQIEAAPLTTSQERQLARDAERTRRSAATVRGEEARADRLAGSVVKEQRNIHDKINARAGRDIGRGKARMEEATQLKGTKGATSRGEMQSRISRDSRLSNEKGKAEAAGVERHMGAEATRQGQAVAKAHRKLEADTARAAARRSRFELEAGQKAERAVEKRLVELDRRNARDLDKLAEAAQAAKDDVLAAPPQDRPALRVGERARTLALELAEAYPDKATEFLALADDVATTKAALDAKGIRTEFFFGGDELGKSTAPPSTARLTQAKKLASERQRTSGKLARSLEGQTDKHAKETLDILHNEFRPKVAKEFGSVAGDELGRADHKFATGDDLAKSLAERDLVAWDPTTGKLLEAADVTLDSAVLPKGLHDTVTKYTAVKSPGMALRFYDKATGKWKHTVLALSPRWHVGNIIGNAALATLGAGLTPGQIARNVGEARRLVKAFQDGEDIPVQHQASLRRLLAAGYHNPDLGEVTGMTPGTGRASKMTAATVNGVGKVISKSYTFNEYVDSVNRTMVYLAKNKGGVSSEAAVQLALKAAGDFSKMTPFERNVVRRIIPFYAWQRHITRLAFSLPVEAPGRVAWTLHLAEMQSRTNPDPGADNEFNEGTIPLPGGKRLSVRSLDPYGSSFFMDPSYRGAGYMLNPMLKLGVAATTGLNLNKELKAVGTPENRGGFGAGPSLLAAKSPVRLAQLAAQSIPQVKSFQDLDPLNLSDAKGNAPVRFDTGQPRRVGKGASKKGASPTLTGRKRGQSLARLLGVPFPEAETKAIKK